MGAWKAKHHNVTFYFSLSSIMCSFAEKTYKLLLVYGKELEISKSGVGAPPVSTSSVLCQPPHHVRT